ncbi:MAG: hypothetical protein MRY21_04805 [Simkaniaceae bacterium]|nr:hypothetical protein [Simkaniaceae bacterium]
MASSIQGPGGAPSPAPSPGSAHVPPALAGSAQGTNLAARVVLSEVKPYDPPDDLGLIEDVGIDQREAKLGKSSKSKAKQIWENFTKAAGLQEGGANSSEFFRGRTVYKLVDINFSTRQIILEGDTPDSDVMISFKELASKGGNISAQIQKVEQEFEEFLGRESDVVSKTLKRFDYGSTTLCPLNGTNPFDRDNAEIKRRLHAPDKVIDHTHKKLFESIDKLHTDPQERKAKKEFLLRSSSALNRMKEQTLARYQVEIDKADAEYEKLLQEGAPDSDVNAAKSRRDHLRSERSDIQKSDLRPQIEAAAFMPAAKIDGNTVFRQDAIAILQEKLKTATGSDATNLRQEITQLKSDFRKARHEMKKYQEDLYLSKPGRRNKGEAFTKKLRRERSELKDYFSYGQSLLIPRTNNLSADRLAMADHWRSAANRLPPRADFGSDLLFNTATRTSNLSRADLEAIQADPTRFDAERDEIENSSGLMSGLFDRHLLSGALIHGALDVIQGGQDSTADKIHNTIQADSTTLDKNLRKVLFKEDKEWSKRSRPAAS